MDKQVSVHGGPGNDGLPEQALPRESDVVNLENVELTLSSRAGPVDILRGVSWSVAQGRSVAVVGPSGSGKTSLLMIIAGLERATSGQVQIAGHDFSVLSEDQLAEVRGRRIGIVFQSFHLVPTMTAFENVALPLELTGRSDAHPGDRLRRHVGPRSGPASAGPRRSRHRHRRR